MPSGAGELAARWAAAQGLGVSYYRPATVFLNDPNACADCEAASAQGLQLVLVVRANGTALAPTQAITDVAQYQTALRAVLERYRPALLVVENALDDGQRGYVGTAEEYLAELTAACTVAHALNLLCAAGGLTYETAVGLVTIKYLSNGRPGQVVGFVRRTLEPNLEVDISPAWLSAFLEEHRLAFTRVNTLLAGYQAAGADYANLHWYGADAKALQETVAFLQKATGLPLLSGEMGQRTDDPAQTTAIATAARDLGLRVMIWHAPETANAATGAHPLYTPTGALTPLGEALKAVVQTTP